MRYEDVGRTAQVMMQIVLAFGRRRCEDVGRKAQMQFVLALGETRLQVILKEASPEPFAGPLRLAFTPYSHGPGSSGDNLAPALLLREAFVAAVAGGGELQRGGGVHRAEVLPAGWRRVAWRCRALRRCAAFGRPAAAAAPRPSAPLERVPLRAVAQQGVGISLGVFLVVIMARLHALLSRPGEQRRQPGKPCSSPSSSGGIRSSCSRWRRASALRGVAGSRRACSSWSARWASGLWQGRGRSCLHLPLSVHVFFASFGAWQRPPSTP